MPILFDRPTPFLNLLRGTKTITLGDAHVEVPASVVSQAQVYLRQNRGGSGEDIVGSVAKGLWAQSLARAFCMSEERIDVPEEYLSETEKGCIDTVSLRLAREIII